ncbi:hypothetical protein HJC23_000413 [Cyclotella cryptica]|uniref:Sulfotransferase n=1 Tax=Cyclotella cryptica TaxID=29204 RepID=A0ABD3PJC8_9STRA|eukprot:CCRYP_014155-RA/>CCRYP_014155-RA protein AED:0.39 eAED:0.38 QI:0/-1/0/1/-1/1/1/0/453
MVTKTARQSVAGTKRGGRSATTIALFAIIVLVFVYTVALFIEVTLATGKSYRETQFDPKRKLGSMQMSRTLPETNAPSRAPTPPRISTGHLATWILTSHLNDKDVNTQHSAYERMRQSPAVPLTFFPGSLQLSHAQALKYCYADPAVYKKHIQGKRGDGSNVPVSYSEKFKLAYVMLPKSGSSTARYMLKNQFEAIETSKSLQQIDFQAGGKMEGVEVISFVRDPLSRFFSQYEEAFTRTAPWVTNDNPYIANTHPYPYLFDNIHSYQEYEDVFCPPETRKSRRECIDKPSAENGTLAARLERFVRNYDGRDPFDVHLTLQVPMLSTQNGYPLHITQIYNTTDAEGGWKSIARELLGANSSLAQSGSEGVVIEGRSYPRRLNSKLVSLETQRRICELALLDYCCLNLPLPEVCQGRHFKDDNGVERELFCKLEAKAGRGSERIQPGVFPKEAA